MVRRFAFAALLCATLFSLLPVQPAAAFRLWKPKHHAAAAAPHEAGAGGESLRLLPVSGVPAEHERLRATHIRLLKWKYADLKSLRAAVKRGERPSEIVEHDGNVMCNAGISRMLNLLIGTGSTTAYANASSRVGVGNGTTAVTAADTISAASGSANRWFQTSDATFPSISGQTVTWQVTVTGSNADFAWQEFGIDDGTSNGTTVTAPLLDHGLASLGTKAASTSWQLQVAITES